MEIQDIRPCSTYIGNGGVTKKVKSIYMAVDGILYVEWRLVNNTRRGSLASAREAEPIDKFAKWAKVLKDTLSRDLEHHLLDVNSQIQTARPTQDCASKHPHLSLV